VDVSIQSLVDEHRLIEAELERLAEGVARGAVDLEVLRRAGELCARHYEHEEAFLLRLCLRNAGLAAKLRGQHDEALELTSGAEEAAAAGQAADLTYLARRFLAITQHNMIEEERDVFPFFAEG
jgi:hypothetical protein